MKKQILAVAMASFFASSAVVAVPLPAGGVIETADCATIGNAVTINTSSGVSGAYVCNAAGNAAAIATCHASGSRQARVFTCVSSDAGDDGISGNEDDTWNSDTCPAGDGSTATAGEFTIIDFRGFVASTTGGGVGATALGGACNPDAADGILPNL